MSRPKDLGLWDGSRLAEAPEEVEGVSIKSLTGSGEDFTHNLLWKDKGTLASPILDSGEI